MTYHSYKFAFPIVSIIAVLSFAYTANARNVFDISYPIAELGGCTSQDECKNYCDTPENEITCVRWAQDNGLAPKPESKPDSGKNKDDLLRDEEALANAPGGCKTPRECDAYCRVESNLDECMDYSVKYGYMTKEEADKIRTKAAKGGPGGCKSEQQCNNYCKAPENARECMSFVVEEGKLTQEEADFMVEQMNKPGGPGGKPTGKGPAEPKIKEEKIQAILQDKTGPGGCKTMQECGAYCRGGEHMDECLSFAKENGIMEQEDLEKAKKLMTLGGPGGCKNETECEEFCRKEENGKTCFEFSRDNGLMSEEEVVLMEKQMQIIQKLGKQAGPGGCKTQEECGNYCSDQSNIEECINFAGGQSGGLSGERIKNMMGQTQEAKDKMRQLQEYKNQQMGEKEFSQFGPPPEGFKPPEGSMPPPGEFRPPEGFGGPTEGMTPPPPPPPPPEGNTSMNPLRALGAALIPILDFFLK